MPVVEAMPRQRLQAEQVQTEELLPDLAGAAAYNTEVGSWLDTIHGWRRLLPGSWVVKLGPNSFEVLTDTEFNERYEVP